MFRVCSANWRSFAAQSTKKLQDTHKNHNPLSMCDNFNLKKWMDISKIHGTHWLLRFFYLVLGDRDMPCFPGLIYRPFPAFPSIFPFPCVLAVWNAAERWTSNRHKELGMDDGFLTDVSEDLWIARVCLSVPCFNLSFGSNYFSFLSSCALSLLRNTNNSYPRLLASLGLTQILDRRWKAAHSKEMT